MCYKFLACESKMASNSSGQLSGLPTELPTIFILESSGLPTELHSELPTISVYISSGQPYLHGKIPMGSPLRCPLSCPLFPYMEVVGSLICMAKFPWAAHGQPTVSIYGSSGQPSELPTELPTVSIYGSSGQPNLHGKIPMGSPRAAHSVAHVQPTGSEVGSSPVFSVWVHSANKTLSDDTVVDDLVTLTMNLNLRI